MVVFFEVQSEKGVKGQRVKGTKEQRFKGGKGFFLILCHFDGGEITLITRQRLFLLIAELLV
jgi:hypothetical protein